MQKTLALVFIATMSLFGCHKKNTPPPTNNTNTVPASTFNISYNGKTAHISYDGSNLSDMVYTQMTAPDSTSPIWGIWLSTRNAHVKCSFTGRKLSGPGITEPGVYKSGNNSGGGSNLLELTDYDDAGKVYTSGNDGKDTASTITVTEFTAHRCKGTFSIILSHNGNSYPATGDFDYQH